MSGEGRQTRQANISLIIFMLLRERFLIHDVRHLGDVAAVVPFQYVDQSLHAAAAMPLLGSEDRRVMRAALAKWVVGGSGLRSRDRAAANRRGAALLRNIESGAGDPVLAQRVGQSGLVYHWAAGCVDDHGCGFHHAQRLLVDQVIGWRGAFAFTHQRNVEADEVRRTRLRAMWCSESKSARG